MYGKIALEEPISTESKKRNWGSKALKRAAEVHRLLQERRAGRPVLIVRP